MERGPVIVYPNQGAGLCNRLLAAAHLLAHAEASGNAVWHAALRRYAGTFEGIPENGIIWRRPTRPRPRHLLRNPVALLRSGRFPPGEISFDEPAVRRAEQAALLVLIGWRFRDDAALRAHGDLVRSVFRPSAPHRETVANCLAALRQRCDRVVGVHLRRGDYAAFRGGRYFYSDAVYRRVMAETAGQLTGRTGFLLASDSPVDASAFAGFVCMRAPGHEVADLYALAACDCLIGPPSTYSAWASFYGKIPVAHLEDAVQPVPRAAFASLAAP